MRNRLQVKTALITGGNSGIGLATAQEFVKERAFVYITARRKRELNDAARTIGTNVVAIQADVSKGRDLDHLYAQVERDGNRLDIVFANAGAGAFAPLGSISEDEYNRVFDTNVKGVLFTVQKALPFIPDGGSIILNASIVSINGPPSLSVYAATKAAVRSFC